ncbi:MAG: hypothetical protein WCD37_12040 [Chloroflexia bacterium]
MEQLDLLFARTGGIDSWIREETPDPVFDRLGNLDSSPISVSQLNQLLLLSDEAGMTPAFFNYYWNLKPRHTYDVTKIPGFEEEWIGGRSILSIGHLKWGLYRFYVDALLYFGNIRTAYRTLRTMTDEELLSYFEDKRFNTEFMKERGEPLSLIPIAKDRRYLISEMACKTYDGNASELRTALQSALQESRLGREVAITIEELVSGAYMKRDYGDKAGQFRLSVGEFLNEEVSSEAEINTKVDGVLDKFIPARTAALQNTRYYLSMVGDLDVYVATSMRDRQDFRDMADRCEDIFGDSQLSDLHIRYFDPTMSAAMGHEDKGLIECLMVKCAKALVYCAGARDSYGKDAEAAMALSLGKPVIFLCDEEERRRFYQDVHPLSRLIHFETGVPVGAMVTTSTRQVATLLYRIFMNEMEYEIERTETGYLRLREKLTGSVVRLQTSDNLLRETFWNYYHNRT